MISGPDLPTPLAAAGCEANFQLPTSNPENIV
jgi:hypothetical protein